MYYNLDKKEFRSELYDDGIVSAVLRTLRYVRYGRKKRDKVYIRGGDLTGAYIGYGLLLGNYSNTYSEEKRKIGIEFDIRFGDIFGLEGFYSDVTASTFTLSAIRPYFRPLARTEIPILKTLEIGGTLIYDRDQTNNFQGSSYNSLLSDGITAFGTDLGITLIRSNFLTLFVSSQYGQISKIQNTDIEKYIERQSIPISYGNGSAISAGTMINFRFLPKVFSLGLRIYRAWYSDNFIPQFFDTSYEINKNARITSLVKAQSRAGTYGTISGLILNTILVSGTLAIPDKISERNPAALRIYS